MGKEEEISVKELLLRHIDLTEKRDEKSDTWRTSADKILINLDNKINELSTRMDSHQIMVIEEVSSLKEDTERYNSYEKNVKDGAKIFRKFLWFLGALAAFVSFIFSSAFERLINFLFRHG